MREIISLFIGQCGVQIGTSLWQLLCSEHDIDYSGKKIESSDEQTTKNENLYTFFEEIKLNKQVPRSIFMDLDPTTIDQVRKSDQKDLFNQNTLISGKSDASDYCRGKFYDGKLIIDDSLEQIRKQSEKCDSLQGFLICSSTSGGTSSGFGSLIQMNLVNQFYKKKRINCIVIPSNSYSSSTIEPLNSVLALSDLNDYSNINIAFQNEALYNICSNKLDIEQPNFSDINRIISQVISSFTTSIRFNGEMNVSFDELFTNLVPYRKVNFTVPSYSPFINKETCEPNDYSIYQITKSIFENDSCFVDCQLNTRRFLACSYMLRGDIIPKDVVDSISQVRSKQTIEFVEWCPTGFKLGVNSVKPKSLINDSIFTPPVDGCLISNTSSFNNFLQGINEKFDKLYAKRAFVHWYVGNEMEEGQFSEARENLHILEQNYEEVITDYFFDEQQGHQEEEY